MKLLFPEDGDEFLIGIAANPTMKVAVVAPVAEPENINPLNINSDINQTMQGHPGIASHNTGIETPIDQAEDHGGIQNPTTAATDPNSGDATEFARWWNSLPALD